MTLFSFGTINLSLYGYIAGNKRQQQQKQKNSYIVGSTLDGLSFDVEYFCPYSQCHFMWENPLISNLNIKKIFSYI